MISSKRRISAEWQAEMTDLNKTIPPRDQQQRDLATQDLATTYLVEAAAGTGKTTILVERILSIVRQKQKSLTKIAAITFTEKAAGDLKIKLRKRLEQQAQAETAKVKLYRDALLELDLMPVGTIHGFCRDLIQQRPVEAGIDPTAQVADQAIADALADEIWTDWISEELSQECKAARPFLEWGVNIESTNREFSLRTLYDFLIHNREDLAQLHVSTVSETDLLQNAKNFHDRLLAEIESHLSQCLNKSDLCAVQLLRIQEWLNKLPQLTGLEAVRQWLEAAEKPKGGGGSKANWSSVEALENAKEFRRAFLRKVDQEYSHWVGLYGESFLRWLSDGVQRYQEAKIERGLLDFHDLLLLARNMLAHSREAREFFKRRFDYLLVDEFQDTDPLQAEIVFYLAEREEQFAERWENVQLISGKLFIVGDPKQSIYRFRRADLDLYGRVQELIQQSGHTIRITENFRSVPAIIEEVNGVFSQQMSGPANGRYEPYYEPMVPHRDETSDFPRAIFLPPPESFAGEKIKAEDSAKAEAACIAEYIGELIGAGYCIEENGVARAIAYRDIGVLYRQTTSLWALEAALRSREIPYQVSGGKEYASRVEFQALRTVLAALDNPFDSVRVVGALRSPFFGCSDEELLRHRLSGGEFNYLTVASEEPYLQECFAILRNLYEARTRRTPSETISALFDVTEGLQVFALKPLGDGRVANLLKVLDIARALENGQMFSFHDLVQWLMDLRDISTGEGDSPLTESGEDSVQLMTFHKAKGLEFPVVILYRLGQEGKGSQGPLLDRKQHTVDFRVGTREREIQTARFASAKADEAERERCENLRLLYVAMTRAREQLVIPAYWTQKPVGFFEVLNSRYPQLASGTPDTTGTGFHVHDVSGYDLSSKPRESLRIDLNKPLDPAILEQSEAKRAEWEEGNSRAVQALNHEPLFATASRKRKELETSTEPTQSTDAGAEEAITFGTYIHRIMERIELPDGDNLECLSKSIAADLDITSAETIDTARDLVQRTLNSDPFRQRVANAEAVYRELEYTAELDGIIYEGKMDLVFIENGAPVIVDYKTDRVTAEQTAHRANFHRPQAAIYSRALEKITGQKPAATLLYFLRPGVAIPV
jgi:ATP-dependent exoDNAse (exonuclease V) beta subunit